MKESMSLENCYFTVDNAGLLVFFILTKKNLLPNKGPVETVELLPKCQR